MNQTIQCWNGKYRVYKQDIFVYDDSEPSNCEAFKRLPPFYQDYITAKHADLRNFAFHILEKYGYKPIFTSGFRSVYVNKKVGGVSDSLHIHGLAVDLILIDIYNSLVDIKLYPQIIKKIGSFDEFQLFAEKNHIHLQFSRNFNGLKGQ